ncbi:hypothetical protein I3760_03G224600 [Carya illinoinensis]|nr:hypothetical protein I3760_03G224600 [Carya illinoinensis]
MLGIIFILLLEKLTHILKGSLSINTGFSNLVWIGNDSGGRGRGFKGDNSMSIGGGGDGLGGAVGNPHKKIEKKLHHGSVGICGSSGGVLGVGGSSGDGEGGGGIGKGIDGGTRCGMGDGGASEELANVLAKGLVVEDSVKGGSSGGRIGGGGASFGGGIGGGEGGGIDGVG